MSEKLKNQMLIAVFQVNLALFIVAACFLDSDSIKPFLIVLITGIWMGLFFLAQYKDRIRRRIRELWDCRIGRRDRAWR